MSEKVVGRAVMRALLRCARRVEGAQGVWHLKRNAADVVIRSTNARLPGEMYDCVVACTEVGPRRACRAAFEAARDDDALDRGLRAVRAASEVARFAEILDRRRSFLDGDDSELGRVEAEAFRVAALAGASDDDIVAARQALTPNFELSRATSVWDVATKLTGRFEAAADFDDPDSHRLDAVAAGARGVPIVVCVATMALARRAGLASHQIVGVGAPGRFLLGLRDVGVQRHDGLAGDWFAERELFRVTVAPASAAFWPDRQASLLEAVAVTGDGHVSWRVLLGSGERDLAVGSRRRALLRRTDRSTRAKWVPATCVVVNQDELAVLDETNDVAVHVRRSAPSSHRSVVFMDCYNDGSLYTRAQLLRRDRRQAKYAAPYSPPQQPAARSNQSEEEDDDLQPPLPRASARDIARRMCRNLQAAAKRRGDPLQAMLFAHAELDIATPHDDRPRRVF